MKRRAELTFQHSRTQGRYGWLRLTPAYSLRMVQRYLPDNEQTCTVLDPFCGSGTTPLYAAYQGLEAQAIDINPFLVWFTRVKTATYAESTIQELRDAAQEITSDDRQARPVNPPPIKNIERWWNDQALTFLCAIKGGIEEYRRNAFSEHAIDLLYVCFCRTLIKISNAAFNHQSMSFDDDHGQLSLFDEKEHYKNIFLSDVKFVADSAADNPAITSHVIQGDARKVNSHVQPGIDITVTSPPYPNRMSYIRELRPYMYWLGYLEKAREAGELDWKAIGGTWGIATSRLSDWTRDETRGYYPDYFERILEQIADGKHKNGDTMANYVARYFEDTLEHFQSLVQVLNRRARVHYVVGNSTFYNVLLPVERLYKEIMELAGLSRVNVETVRKRNSKKELYEFTVSGEYV